MTIRKIPKILAGIFRCTAINAFGTDVKQSIVNIAGKAAFVIIQRFYRSKRFPVQEALEQTSILLLLILKIEKKNMNEIYNIKNEIYNKTVYIKPNPLQNQCTKIYKY